MTKEALEKSIAHWEENARAETPDGIKVDGDGCPLCEVYAASENPDYNCTGCPVAKRTGKLQCEGTPWEQAYSAYRKWREAEHRGFLEVITSEHKASFHTAAQKEVAFLKSLLPQYEQAGEDG